MTVPGRGGAPKRAKRPEPPASVPRDEPLSDAEARLLAYGAPNIMFPRAGKGTVEVKA